MREMWVVRPGDARTFERADLPEPVSSDRPGPLAVVRLRPQGLTGRARSATLFTAACVVAIPLLLPVGGRTGGVIVVALPVLPPARLPPTRPLAPGVPP